MVLVKVIYKGKAFPPRREGWVTDLLLSVSFLIINTRKRTDCVLVIAWQPIGDH